MDFSCFIIRKKKKSAGSTCYSVTFPVMFFYFKIISILLLPQALTVCTLHIILSSSLWLWGWVFFASYPKFWAGSLRGTFLECARHQDLPFTLEYRYLFFAIQLFYAGAFDMQQCTGCQGDSDLGQISNLYFGFGTINTTCWELSPALPSKQASLFSTADAVWFTRLHLLIMRRQGVLYQWMWVIVLF